MIAITITSGVPVLVWLISLGAVFVVMLIVAFFLIRAMKAPKNMSKKDFEAVLASSADEAKHVTTAALNDISVNLSREFETELSSSIKKSLSKFGENLEETLQNAISQYNETLINVQADVKKYLATTEQTIASNSGKLDQQLHEAVEAQKAIVISKIQTKLNSILASYLNQSLSGSIDISSQQDFIIEQLEASKQALIEDIQSVRH